ncbi:tonB-system energizer ExbB [Altererythrobacter palmitatis]|uniref:Biopolymer transport protein ExbB n=1 Tax=Alteraurantiacibacter palmitatis TaxID=2054628 RepID=A0ABV7ECU8_9SPHN
MAAAAAVHLLFANNAAATTTAGALPSTLSVGGMFMQADWIVKLVMIGLALASVITWTVFVAKQLQLKRERAGAVEILSVLASARTLGDLPADVSIGELVREAKAELALSVDALDDREGVKERIVSRLDRYEARLARRMTQGITVLGTIGATAPFVGLFGTVWGIMNSFIGIAEMQTTNLAVVAPGIAEALLATGLGLVAAIPAVVIYNHFARQIAAHRALVSDSAAAVLRLVSRDLSRGTLPAPAPAKVA